MQDQADLQVRQKFFCHQFSCLIGRLVLVSPGRPPDRR
jgi:hypothetical protein